MDLATYRPEVVGERADAASSPGTRSFSPCPAQATLAIACVEGVEHQPAVAGVRVRDLLERAGAPEGATVTVVSAAGQQPPETSLLSAGQADDRDTLLAVAVNDEDLHPDHGFPVRLIGPNRPGVQQTKWVGRLEVLVKVPAAGRRPRWSRFWSRRRAR